MRSLVNIGLALVLVITLSSAFIRLSQSGPSCPEWHACYSAQAGTPAALSEESPVFFARTVHRIAASAAGILFLVIAARGWVHWRGDSRRIVALALVVLAGLLAWLGKYTSSALPAVALGNLLGGMALLGLLAWLRQSAAGGKTPQARPRIWVALALAALQIVLGVAMLFADFSVTLAMAHNAIALLLLVVLASMLARPSPEESRR